MAPNSPKRPKKAAKPAPEKAKVPTPPNRLGEAGTRLWNEVHAELPARWVFTAVELDNLEAAAVLADRLEQLNDLIERDGPMVAGSKGQKVLHPALVEARLVAQAKSKHLGLVEIPNVETGRTETAASIRGRNAANARWAKRDAYRAKVADVKRRRRGEA